MTIDLRELPASAAWRHRGLRDGFEVAHFATSPGSGATRIWGNTVATEGSTSFAVTYLVVVDEHWNTREASIETRTRDRTWRTHLVCDGHGTWTVDGVVRPELSACTDVDLEASVVTNTIPVHRLSAACGTHNVSAVYVRATEPEVEVLEQTYFFASSGSESFTCAYTAPQFDYSANLYYDASGLIVDYPDLAIRTDRFQSDVR